METKWAAAIFLGIFGPAQAYAGDPIRVHVYLDPGNWIESMAVTQQLAAELFSQAGVRLMWHSGDLPEEPGDGSRRISIRIVTHAPATVTPMALAAARPYASGGPVVQVYEKRVKKIMARLPSVSNVFLAYVIAHELGHVVMRNDYHSSSGVMKAQWSTDDYAAMRARRLLFTNGDSQRIREALSR